MTIDSKRTEALMTDDERDLLSGLQGSGDQEAGANSPNHRDIYALLGVRKDASALLAREMYWARIQPLLDSETRDDPDARSTIEALNRALAIISNAQVRADYDARSSAERVPIRAKATRTELAQRWFWRGMLIAGLASAVLILGAQTSWVLALAMGAASLALVTATILILRPRQIQQSVHERLGVQEDATKRDLEIAYQAQAHHLLVRLGSDSRVVDALNQLDRDYLTAMRVHMATAPTRAPRRVLLPLVGRTVVMGIGMILRLRVTLTDRMSAYEHRRSQDRHTSSEGSDSQPGDRHSLDAIAPSAGPERSARRWDPIRKTEQVAPPVIDLEQRLAASFKATALEIASAPPADRPEQTAVAQAQAHLLLFAAAGVRRVPIAERPLRIGSSSDCDLVLPERQGVAFEHALIWRRGDSVVLHVTDPAGGCIVNGYSCTWATLEHDDTLRIGDVELRIEIDASTD